MPRCTFTSTAYLTIRKTECALLDLSQNEASHVLSFLTRKIILAEIKYPVLQNIAEVFNLSKESIALSFGVRSS